MKNISDEMLEGVSQMIDNYFGIEVDVRYVAKIMSNSGDSEWLQQEVVDGAYTDTMVRDVFADAIAQDLVGCSLPLNMDGPSGKFFKKLKVAANDKGFSTIWDK